ncbi:trypsin, alkaline C-like, partial [Hyposmocoma kahamanoa]|uniref:trypsin, alkaline C-like n=1 Tax=Hyposmocoma kahamanoa TaxID=1477025 RepID=UPI000E6D77C2
CSRDSANRFRIRVGSSFANSGGVVHYVYQYSNHPDFRWIDMDNNISIIRTATIIDFVINAVQPATLADSNYIIGDNIPVLVSGWNHLNNDGSVSEQLHHTFLWTVNQQLCQLNYQELGFSITQNMICAGWLDVGGRGQCTGDSGSPLIHHNQNINTYVVLAITSYNHYCGHSRYFGINTRVSNYISWIGNNV